jgi:hypothetical protein
MGGKERLLSDLWSNLDPTIFKAVLGLKLPEKEWIQRIARASIRGIEIEPIPDSLKGAAVLVSNYPSVKEALNAVLKVACLLPGEGLRLKAIARGSILTENNPLVGGLLAGGIFPAEKIDGIYRLNGTNTKRALAHLKGGGVLWLSPTGDTEENGLKVENLRHGVVEMALKCGIPIVPMGLEINSKKKVVRVRFGNKMILPAEGNISVYNRDEHVHLLSVLVLARIAQTLPAGQRGDFEDVDSMIPRIFEKLSAFQEVKDLC